MTISPARRTFWRPRASKLDFSSLCSHQLLMRIDSETRASRPTASGLEECGEISPLFLFTTSSALCDDCFGWPGDQTNGNRETDRHSDPYATSSWISN